MTTETDWNDVDKKSQGKPIETRSWKKHGRILPRALRRRENLLAF